MKIIIGGVSYDVTFEKSRSKIADNEPLGQISYIKGKIQIFKKSAVYAAVLCTRYCMAW